MDNPLAARSHSVLRFPERQITLEHNHHWVNAGRLGNTRWYRCNGRGGCHMVVAVQRYKIASARGETGKRGYANGQGECG